MPRPEGAVVDSSRPSVEGDDASRRTVVYPDNQQLFIGNLPLYMPDLELKDFFERKLISLSFTVLPEIVSFTFMGYLINSLDH